MGINCISLAIFINIAFLIKEMSFKVILKHASTEGDEHTYYGIVFLKSGQNQSKRLEFSESENILKATFTFDGHPVESGENYLAVLIPVNEGERIDNPEFKIQFNSPAPEPEIVNF